MVVPAPIGAYVFNSFDGPAPRGVTWCDLPEGGTVQQRSIRLMARLAGLSVAVLSVAVLAAAVPAGLAHAGPVTANVRDFGAKGNGSTLDDDAIDRAINAAAAGAGGGVVLFPAGTYQSRSIHLKSNITLQLASGATIRAASSGFDAPEANSFSRYQDFGHSHFHNSLLWGENVSNVTFTGTGTIDGGGHLVTSNSVPSGRADKALTLKLCANLVLRGITIRRGGHFAVLMNGCHDVQVDNVKILTSGDRDGINVINSWNVDIGRSRVESQDDAVVFKSDFALGRTFLSHHVVVHDDTILSTHHNATQFGSETCGDFQDFVFRNLTITGAGKAGIGIVSQDGAHISDLHYSGIRMTRTAIPIYLKLGNRAQCPGSPPTGRISGVTISDVTATNAVSPVSGAPEFTSTIAGAPGVDIEGVTLTNVNLTVPGGHPASDAGIVPPENLKEHAPRIFGTRPSYGFWLRHVRSITFTNVVVQFDHADGRPAFATDDGNTVTLADCKAERSTGPTDVVFTSTSGYAVQRCTSTAGQPLRIKAVNSTPRAG
jgi:hypothetical protein